MLGESLGRRAFGLFVDNCWTVCGPPFLKKLIPFSIQTNLSKEFVMLRNKFSGDITERFNGLLQVNVDNNDDYHFNQGIRVQKRLTRVDVLIGYCQAFIGSFKQVVLFFSIIFLLIFMYLSSYEYTIDLALIASVSASLTLS